ncbi:translation initiation factor IF-3 [Candidatus Nomurabacteria bacterium RIFCSPLOWO2_01_FULL_33_24]|uniref:Translation initiation factor IF-3 n=1 Tax=Candidatus Nomurabacteria bacterium RIFCSPLOWO2_01_FULL_33_24 TaxID=1801765 RepID=A0A1F6X243_9BACT|nr:MAG: translation initiation factor IF-3 [Candidatus Nomurabacteria bacterium RIFCSPLOWO2_01_FULL_33_24]
MIEKINNQIRVKEVRVISDDGENFGVLDTQKAIKLAEERGLDLIEISPNANPPVAKITDYGRFQYEKNKKQKKAKENAHLTETKSIQIKIGTGKNDLNLKAKRASEWLREGHRIKVELFLPGRTKYMDKKFLEERLNRILNLITEEYKIAEEFKKVPKGVMITLEKGSKKEKNENK